MAKKRPQSTLYMLYWPTALHRECKAEASRRGITIGDLIVQAVAAFLGVKA